MEFIARGQRVHAKLTQSGEQMSEFLSLTFIINPQKCHLSFKHFSYPSLWKESPHGVCLNIPFSRMTVFWCETGKVSGKVSRFCERGVMTRGWPLMSLSVVWAQALAGRLNWVRLLLIADWPVWELLVLGSALIAEVESPKPSRNFNPVGPGNRCREAKGDLEALD